MSHHIRQPALSLLLARSQSRSAPPNCERSPFLRWIAHLVGVTVPVCLRQARRATAIRRFWRRIGIILLNVSKFLGLETPCWPCAADKGISCVWSKRTYDGFPRCTLSLINRR